MPTELKRPDTIGTGAWLLGDAAKLGALDHAL